MHLALTKIAPCSFEIIFKHENRFMMSDFYVSPFTSHISYSVLKLFTGFAIAAFIAWKLTVINAMMIEAIPPIRNSHQLISILNVKFCNHRFIKYHANGVAIT